MKDLGKAEYRLGSSLSEVEIQVIEGRGYRRALGELLADRTKHGERAMSVERKWVLRAGVDCFYNGAVIDVGLDTAMHFETSEQAQEEAQIKAARLAKLDHCLSFLYAIPIERETERKVEEIEGPAELWVLRDKSDMFMRPDEGWSSSLQRARLFAPSDLYEREFSAGTPIPVRVTETPGEWKEVEQDD